MSESPAGGGTTPWRIIFMGTPEFAVPTLEALAAGPDDVVAVIAQPDRPAKRGRKVHVPPTIQVARRLAIPTHQPARVRGPRFVETLAHYDPDLIVVVAYGRILTEAVLECPRHGCVNVHASLLPKYRGASPIQWALLRGETVTGVTTMLMDAGLDTGDILLARELPIPPGANAGELHDLLAPIGAELLVETVARMKRGTVRPRPQDSRLATRAPLLKKEDGLIDWNRPAREIDWHVRGMTPWPGAFTFLDGTRIVVLDGAALPQPADAPPGTLLKAEASGLMVSTGEGCYQVRELKPENSRAMAPQAFLCGHRPAVGARFSSDRGVS